MTIALSQPITKTDLRNYVTLMKPRVMSLAVFTAVAGMFLAPGHLSFFSQCIAIVSLALGAGAAGAINMWLECDRDARMERTKNRPIPAGRISASSAIRYALICTIVSVVMMATVNMLASFLLLTTIVFYAGIYTVWLKPNTPISIVIGGAAGALPPVIGWAAVTGNISLEPLFLFLIIFLWTPPHFWALALTKSEEYRAAGIPTLPLVVGNVNTKRQIFIYTLLLFFSSLLPAFFHEAGLLYALGAIALGGGFIFHAARLWKEKDIRYAMPLFFYSLLYLMGIFAFLIIDRLVYA